MCGHLRGKERKEGRREQYSEEFTWCYLRHISSCHLNSFFSVTGGDIELLGALALY